MPDPKCFLQFAHRKKNKLSIKRKKLFKECITDPLTDMPDEGRSSLRKVSASWQTSFDPEISQWGNPSPLATLRAQTH